jgi:hypothetical protein
MDNTLLLDSCSTVNLIANKSLLHGIHQVPITMHIQSNAGVTTTNLKGWLGDFPEPVWYNPDGVANIMSLFVIKKYYRVRYDSNRQDALLVTKPNGGTMVFFPSPALRKDCTPWLTNSPDGFMLTQSPIASGSTPSASTVMPSSRAKSKTSSCSPECALTPRKRTHSSLQTAPSAAPT